MIQTDTLASNNIVAGFHALSDPLRVQVLDLLRESAPPDSRTSWTLQLLADRLVQLEVIETVSPNTIGRTLKKTI